MIVYCRLSGLFRRATLSARSEPDLTYVFPPVAAGLSGKLALESEDRLPEGAQPRLTFLVSEGRRLVKALEPPLEWTREGTTEVDLAFDPPSGNYFYGRVWDLERNEGVEGTVVVAGDTGEAVKTGERGFFEFISRNAEILLEAPDVGVPPVRVSVAQPYAFLARVLTLTGFAHNGLTGEPAKGLRVELWDRGQGHAATTNADGSFVLYLSRDHDPPREPAFRVYQEGRLIPVLGDSGPIEWGEWGARVELAVNPAGEPVIYTVSGTAIDRATREPIADAKVEAWAGAAVLTTVTTDAAGRFGLTVDGPDVSLRAHVDGQFAGQLAVTRWRGTESDVVLELDRASPKSTELRLTGLAIDRLMRTGLPGLRIEAWDNRPRDGGHVGVDAVTGADGGFTILLPASLALPVVTPRPLPVPRVGNGNGTDATAEPASELPLLTLRVYWQDRLLETLAPEIQWAGVSATVVLELAAPMAASQEVGLHELGESIATTVDRVQTELARYPHTMGTYVLDEIALDMPVEMRVDELGQVRTKVVDATTPEKNVGQVRMTVRPVLGVTRPAADVANQPLTVLSELSGPALATLAGQRIYTVEDLARAATTGAGRAALTALKLGVDLEALLAKATLLAFAALPRAVREAAIALGVTTLADFAGRDPAALATALAAQLGQVFTADDVTAWQATVRTAFTVPRPSEEVPS